MKTIFDIETGSLPLEQLCDLIPPFDPAEVRCGNLKDPAKIAAKIAEAEAEHEAKFVERAALSAMTSRVLALGLCRGDDVKVIAHEDERRTIETFWEFFVAHRKGKGRLIGFNSHRFDVPYLVRRSWILGVRLPGDLFDRSGRLVDTFVDLMQVWGCGVYGEYASLDAVCRACGLGSKNGHGADFARLWRGTAEEHAQAEAYLRNDLMMTWNLAGRLGQV